MSEFEGASSVQKNNPSRTSRNGLPYRGERIRTSDLLVPNQISMLIERCGNVGIFDACD
jgi:hypothetical protein